MKKLLILGGSRYVIPLINTAHELGIYVITCDYLPDNVAHRYSDKFLNISIIDKDEVLKAAEDERIDGIVSFACDPGVVTVAYIAEKMGLPFQCSYESACILQDKGRFRQFLIDNDFNCPRARSYQNYTEAFNDVDYFNWPVIVKPVDSAGSKGVTKVDELGALKEAVEEAVKNSHSGHFIIEEFLTFQGYHSSADPFTVDGKISFMTYSDQLFDEEADNPYTPAKIIWPSSMAKNHQGYLTSETQRLFDLLGMKTGIYNIETCVDIEGNPYLMEVSPRGGGCKIAEIQEMAYGVKLIENEVRKAVGMDLIPIERHELDGHWCEMVIHAALGQSGRYESIDIDHEIMNKCVKLMDLEVKSGDTVHPFTGANMALGDMFLRFNKRTELDDVMGKGRDWLKISLK